MSTKASHKIQTSDLLAMQIITVNSGTCGSVLKSKLLGGKTMEWFEVSWVSRLRQLVNLLPHLEP
jgi:hypothetical protein